MKKTMFHTQESRKVGLKMAVCCRRDDAWLGEGYYFWADIEDAEFWGNKSKRKTGFYEIYTGNIESKNILDTVFDEEGYRFWLAQLEKIAKKLIIQAGEKPSLKELNDYFRDHGIWKDMDGILFQDLPTNNNRLLVKPIEYTHEKTGKTRYVAFAYKKRVQLVVYNIGIITTFELYRKNQVL